VYRQFQQRRFEDRDYVYVWADGVHFNVRLEDDRLRTLVLLGARQDGSPVERNDRDQKEAA